MMKNIYLRKKNKSKMMMNEKNKIILVIYLFISIYAIRMQKKKHLFISKYKLNYIIYI